MTRLNNEAGSSQTADKPDSEVSETPIKGPPPLALADKACSFG